MHLPPGRDPRSRPDGCLHHLRVLRLAGWSTRSAGRYTYYELRPAAVQALAEHYPQWRRRLVTSSDGPADGRHRPCSTADGRGARHRTARTMVIGSGVMASRLSPGDTGLQLLENSWPRTPSGCAHPRARTRLRCTPEPRRHARPVARRPPRRRRTTGASVAPYIAAQTLGAVAGAVLANLIHVPQGFSETGRSGAGVSLGEVVATAGLVALVLTLHRTHRISLAAPAIGAYIAAAY